MLTPRPLGRSGLRAAPLGLAGRPDVAPELVERAFHELGVNYFFLTTRMKGLVEGVRRLVAAGHRDRIVLAMGARIPTAWGVEREFRNAARAVGVETIDVFHLFWVQAHFYVTGKTWPAMRAIKESGRARALAVSCHDRPMARALVDELDLDVLMLRYNAAHRGAEKEVFEPLGDGAGPRPGIVSYTATRWGRLLQRAGELGPMTGPECYRFALTHPAVDVVLCGAESWEELVADAAGVEEGPLAAPRLIEIRRFGDVVRASATGKIGWMGA
jgi:aryl-alcohol dehydrogenase-like predicted oxidoreductase